MRLFARGALVLALTCSPLALMAQTTLGTGSQASPTGTAVGQNAQALGPYASAYGWGADASGQGSWAGGMNALSSGPDSIALGPYAQATGTNAIAIGPMANASGTASTAMGQSANAAGEQTTAVGANTSAQQLGDTSVGAGAATSGGDSTAVGAVASATAFGANAFGNNAKANAAGCTALGTGSMCDVAGVLSVGYDGSEGGTAVYSRIMNAAPGIAPNDVMVMMQGQGLASALGGGAGFSGGTFVAPNYALGSQSFNNVGSALSYLYSLDGGTPTPPAGGGGSSTDPNAVHYDNASKGTITLGGADGTTISNVAPGAVSATSTEAINGGQLYASQQAGQAYTNQQVQAGINQSENWAKSYTDAKFDQLNDRFNSVAAIGQASASMAGNYRNTSNSVAAGLGNSGGRNALAVGYRHVSDDGRFSWSIQGAIAGSERSIGVGAGFGW